MSRKFFVFVLLCGMTVSLEAQTYDVLRNFAGASGTPPDRSVLAGATINFETLAVFDGANGKHPDYGYLVQGLDGNFYGTTANGGNEGYGTVFRITPAGILTVLHDFCSESGCIDGSYPSSGVIQASDGNFYGTTQFGGEYNGGSVFKLTPAGELTTLFSFCSHVSKVGICTDGGNLLTGLVQASDGNLYGTTFSGGATDYGTVFRLTLEGEMTILRSFCAGTGPCLSGMLPFGRLLQASDGNLYGTNNIDFPCDAGTVYKITLEGELRLVYSFCDQQAENGENPMDGLVQAANGTFYGTTNDGGTSNFGTVFALTPQGKLTVLHTFTGGSDGANPVAGLILASDGNFYGTTSFGGLYNEGTIYRITPGGRLTILHNFCSHAVCGQQPLEGLLQATNGVFYGTTPLGGKENDGTIFSLSTGLAPFIELSPTSGSAGAQIVILGMGLTGSKEVEFNDTPAQFTIPQAGEIIATVPAGATTGYVTVTTPSGTLRSSETFTVTP